jgi:holo-[acyl-carrier protein] synthase
VALSIMSQKNVSTSIIGIGVDAVDLDRFAVMLERTPSTRDRIFTIEERNYAAKLANPIPNLAARFAAREATMKALGVGLGAFDLHDVWIRNEVSGRPVLEVEGGARVLAQEAGITEWSVSLTHSATIAIAYVVASGIPSSSKAEAT